jgi:hypothetical protein
VSQRPVSIIRYREKDRTGTWAGTGTVTEKLERDRKIEGKGVTGTKNRPLTGSG